MAGLELVGNLKLEWVPPLHRPQTANRRSASTSTRSVLRRTIRRGWEVDQSICSPSLRPQNYYWKWWSFTLNSRKKWDSKKNALCSKLKWKLQNRNIIEKLILWNSKSLTASQRFFQNVPLDFLVLRRPKLKPESGQLCNINCRLSAYIYGNNKSQGAWSEGLVKAWSLQPPNLWGKLVFAPSKRNFLYFYRSNLQRVETSKLSIKARSLIFRSLKEPTFGWSRSPSLTVLESMTSGSSQKNDATFVTIFPTMLTANCRIETGLWI